MCSRLTLFYAAGALAFSVFAISGLANAPLWKTGPVRPFEATAFDRARHELSLAEEALRGAALAKNAKVRAAYAEEALARADESLSLRPLNPHAWHARASERSFGTRRIRARRLPHIRPQRSLRADARHIAARFRPAQLGGAFG